MDDLTQARMSNIANWVMFVGLVNFLVKKEAMSRADFTRYLRTEIELDEAEKLNVELLPLLKYRLEILEKEMPDEVFGFDLAPSHEALLARMKGDKRTSRRKPASASAPRKRAAPKTAGEPA